MTTYKLHSNPFRAVLSTLLAPLAAARRRLARAQRQAAARRDLSRLGDAALRDMGLDRTEIGSVAAETFGDAEHSRLRPIPRQHEGL
jgi:uncharacterized protein YjiS (DUF1127 family)